MTLNGRRPTRILLQKKMRLSEPTTKILNLNEDRPRCQRQKCRPMTGDERFMRIFAEVTSGGGVKRQRGCRQRLFSAFSLAISSETIEMVQRYSDTQSIVGFSVIPKCMTLNDLKWLFRVKFCFSAGLSGSDRATFEK